MGRRARDRARDTMGLATVLEAGEGDDGIELETLRAAQPNESSELVPEERTLAAHEPRNLV